MAKDIQAIFSQAALVRDESGESENTAQRVGGTLADLTEYVGNMERDVSENINSAVNNAKKELNTRINDCVTTQRFKGEAADSRADTDPFIVLGRFSRNEGESVEAYYGRINAAIDGTFSQSAGSANSKYCGDMRVITNGVRTNIHQYVINFDEGKYVQVADGPIDVDANGKLLFSRDNYKVFSRLIEGGVAGSWTEFGGRDSSVLDIGTFDGINAACAYAARSEIAGNRNAVVLIFHIRTPDPNKTMQGQIFQQWMHDDVSMQIRMYDRRLHRRNVTGASGTAGTPTNPFPWEETGAHKLAFDAPARKLSMKSYENGVVAELTLPMADKDNAGLMSPRFITRLDTGMSFSEGGSTRTAVVINYPNWNVGNYRTFSISAATTAKAGVMSADDKARLNSTLVASVGAFDRDISDITKSNPVTVEMNSTQTKGGDIVFAWSKSGMGSLQLTSAGFYYCVNGKYYNLSAEPDKPIPNKNGILTNRAKTAAYICVNDELVKIIGD